jgi:hypothetical protein
MALSRNRLSRFLTDSRPACEPVFYSRSNFYREEFLKCQRCLDQQREYYSERTIDDVEQALRKILNQLDHLCTSSDADQVVSQLLSQFNIVTGPNSWTDPRHVN